MNPEACAICEEPLVLELEPDSDTEDIGGSAQTTDTVQDDVELRCGCHYHWECLLGAYSITECPTCSKHVSSLSSSGQQQVICTVRNEGGVQENFDILPSAIEEAYLRTYPEERKGHAYLEFCREGDIDAIIHLIKDREGTEDEDPNEKDDLLRYQGTFEGIEGSGLHVALRYNQQEVAWLMLVLGSSLDWSEFPSEVLQAMELLGLTKNDRSAIPDIRTLQDSEGKTSSALAEEIGGVWSDWNQSRRLIPR